LVLQSHNLAGATPTWQLIIASHKQIYAPPQKKKKLKWVMAMVFMVAPVGFESTSGTRA